MSAQRKANWFAMLWAGGVALCLVYVPAIVLPLLTTSRTTYERTATGGLSRDTERTVGVLEGASSAEYFSVLLPFLVAMVPLLLARSERRRRVASAIAAGLVGLYVVLGAMTIGLLYLPAAMGLAVAVMQRPTPIRSATT